MEILSLGEKIRRRRKSLHLTLKDVAGENVTPAQLSYIESDKCKPSTSLLYYICSRLDLDVDYVLEPVEKQAEEQCRLLLDEYDLFIKKGDLFEAEGILEKVCVTARMYKLEAFLGSAALKKSVYKLSSGNLDDAEFNCVTALTVFMGLDEREQAAYCCSILGKISYYRGKLETALEYFLYGMDLISHIQLRDKSILNSIVLYIVNIYGEMGRYDDVFRIKSIYNYNDGITSCMELEPSRLPGTINISKQKTHQFLEFLGKSLKVLKSRYVNGEHVELLDYLDTILNKAASNKNYQHYKIEKNMFLKLESTDDIIISITEIIEELIEGEDYKEAMDLISEGAQLLMQEVSISESLGYDIELNNLHI